MAFLESRVQQFFRDGVWVVMYRCGGKSQRTPEEIEVVKGRATILAEGRKGHSVPETAQPS